MFTDENLCLQHCFNWKSKEQSFSVFLSVVYWTNSCCEIPPWAWGASSHTKVNIWSYSHHQSKVLYPDSHCFLSINLYLYFKNICYNIFLFFHIILFYHITYLLLGITHWWWLKPRLIIIMQERLHWPTAFIGECIYRSCRIWFMILVYCYCFSVIILPKTMNALIVLCKKGQTSVWPPPVFGGDDIVFNLAGFILNQFKVRYPNCSSSVRAGCRADCCTCCAVSFTQCAVYGTIYLLNVRLSAACCCHSSVPPL